MAAAFRAQSFFTTIASGTTTTGTEPTVPSATVQDDFIFAELIVEGNGAITAPTGWTTLWTGAASTAFQYWAGWIVRGASAPSYVWTHSNQSYRELHITSCSGVDTTTPVNQSANTTPASVSRSTNPDPPSVTPTVSNALIICGGFHWSGAQTTWAAPTNYTLRSDTATANDDGCVATRVLSGGSGSAEDPGGFNGGSAVSDQCWAFTIALAPSGGAAPADQAKTTVVSGAIDRSSSW